MTDKPYSLLIPKAYFIPKIGFIPNIYFIPKLNLLPTANHPSGSAVSLHRTSHICCSIYFM